MTLYAQNKQKVSPRAQLIEDAKRRGVVALQCETCGCKHGLSRMGAGCNAAHPEIDGETCEGWDLVEVFAPSAAGRAVVA